MLPLLDKGQPGYALADGIAVKRAHYRVEDRLTMHVPYELCTIKRMVGFDCFSRHLPDGVGLRDIGTHAGGRTAVLGEILSDEFLARGRGIGRIPRVGYHETGSICCTYPID